MGEPYELWRFTPGAGFGPSPQFVIDWGSDSLLFEGWFPSHGYRVRADPKRVSSFQDQTADINLWLNGIDPTADIPENQHEVVIRDFTFYE